MLPALAQCSLDDSEIGTMHTIIRIFADTYVGGGGVAYVREQLALKPQVSIDDREKLIDGAYAEP